MRTKLIPYLTVATLAGILTASVAVAKPKKEPPAPVELTAKGKQLEAAYAAEMKKLKQEIQRAVAPIDAGKKAAYQKALEAEKAARSQFKSAKSATGGVKRAQGLVNHAKGKNCPKKVKGHSFYVVHHLPSLRSRVRLGFR